jgi:hypothetical protein
MEKEFVTYKQALALKELGFDEPCMSSKDMNNGQGLIQIPLYQQIFRWFRDKHKLDGWVTPYYSFKGKLYSFLIENGKEENLKDSDEDYKSHEEAESACIDKLIEICKTK